MSSKRETLKEGLLLSSVVVGAIAVEALFVGVGHSNSDPNTMTENEQVLSAVKGDYGPIARLATEPNSRSFIFNATKNGQTETCQGHYQPQANGVELVGKIACTTDAVVNIQK